jgi:hypothetical protein
MSTFHPLETIIHRTPLGVRCLDSSNLLLVTTGLRITAKPLFVSAKTKVAFMTPSGVFAFEGLTGLHDLEYLSEDEVITSPSPGMKYAIQTEDTLGRFLPWGMELTLPRPDVFQAVLFSAPARSAIPGMAKIRGLLVESADKPASFAHIKVHASGVELGAGLADARGHFVLFFPWPNPLQPPSGGPVTSPNTAGRQTLNTMQWPVTLTFFYQPSAQKFICERPDGRIEVVTGQQAGLTQRQSNGWRCVPDLKSLLVQQAARVLLSSGIQSPDLQVMIRFGLETIVRQQAHPAANNSSLQLFPAP